MNTPDTSSDTSSGTSFGPLSGRVAVVTGGTGGIGTAIVARLAREGADVIAAEEQADAVEGDGALVGRWIHRVPRGSEGDADAVVHRASKRCRAAGDSEAAGEGKRVEGALDIEGALALDGDGVLEGDRGCVDV